MQKTIKNNICWVLCGIFVSSAHATVKHWECRTFLGANAERVFITVKDDQSNRIPHEDLWESFGPFLRELPSELTKENLADLISYSPRFRQNVTNFIYSVNTEREMELAPSPASLASQFILALFNKGKPRYKLVLELRRILRLTYDETFGVDEIPVAKKAELWASTLETYFRDHRDNTVFAWIMNEGFIGEHLRVWRDNPLAAPPAIEATSLSTIQSIMKRIDRMRTADILLPGEIVRDTFRRDLYIFKKTYLNELHNNFVFMFGLKDAGFADDIEKTLAPFSDPNVEINDAYAGSMAEAISRITASAHFREGLEKFIPVYLRATDDLVRLSKDPQLTQLERNKLAIVAEEFLISYSVDLENIGLTYDSDVRKSYLPLLRGILNANSRLNREVITYAPLMDLAIPPIAPRLLALPPEEVIEP